MNTDKPILVIGAGSIGERHIRNLWQLGYTNILVYRQRNLPFRDIADAAVTVLLDWNEVVANKPFAAIICTPTAQHGAQVEKCIDAGMHILAEKPLFHQLFDRHVLLQKLAEKNLLLQVGYMLRYHPLLQKVKEYIASRRFGNLTHIQTYWGEYLPAWHPWEDYRQSYAAQKEGGGAALTLSHDMDVVNFLTGEQPVHFKSLRNFSSSLEVSADSAFDAILSYANNATANVHVNFCQKISQRWYKIIFDEAIIDIDYYNACMKIATGLYIKEEKIENFDRNSLFIEELKDFFNTIDAGNFSCINQKEINNSYNIIKICTHEQ